MCTHPQRHSRLAGRHKVRNQILARQNQGERTRPKLLREPNGQWIWSAQAIKPFSIRKMDDKWITQRPLFYLENPWHKPMDRERLPQVRKRFRWA